uniref:Glucosylceramidase n=1 Tax=Heterorhabditis bacteriophora TaxID=37862 RepID=A0A1I7XHB2_HETBA
MQNRSLGSELQSTMESVLRVHFVASHPARYSRKRLRDFVKNHLGPALKTSPYSINLKLMINDDQRFNLPHWADTILSDPETAQYVSGIAIHWYEDFVTPAHVLTLTHERHPDYFMLATEASAGYLPLEHKPIPGDWARAEQYVKDMIVVVQYMRNQRSVFQI